LLPDAKDVYAGVQSGFASLCDSLRLF
jgi:hypothetical protein